MLQTAAGHLKPRHAVGSTSAAVSQQGGIISSQQDLNNRQLHERGESLLKKCSVAYHGEFSTGNTTTSSKMLESLVSEYARGATIGFHRKEKKQIEAYLKKSRRTYGEIVAENFGHLGYMFSDAENADVLVNGEKIVRIGNDFYRVKADDFDKALATGDLTLGKIPFAKAGTETAQLLKKSIKGTKHISARLSKNRAADIVSLGVSSQKYLRNSNYNPFTIGSRVGAKKSNALEAIKVTRAWKEGVPRTTVYGPHTGAGPLGEKVAGTFTGGKYTQSVTADTTTLYRVYGGKAGELGPYWTRTKPSGPLQSRMDSALLPEWGNTANRVSTIQVPKGTTIFEGTAAPQGNLLGGGNQVYIPRVDPKWLAK